MSKSIPYVCPRCRDEGSYTGSLRFGEDPEPTCKNHGKDQHQWIRMEPVNKEKK